MATLYGYARLADEKLEEIKGLEREIGTTLLAFSGGTIGYASLTGDQIARLQAAEQRLGVSLVAVNA